MFQKAIDILKERWPEVALVVILQAAMMLLVEEVALLTEEESQSVAMPLWAGFLLGMGMMLCAIIWQMLYLGFLKTAAVSGTHPQQPMELLRTGRPYFWRILFFQILLGLVLFFLNSVLVSLLAAFVWSGQGLEQVPTWAVQLCGLAGLFILLKPLLLVPAVVLVYDVTVIEALFRIRQFRFFRIDSLLKVTMGSFVLIITTALLIELAQPKTMGYYITSALHHAVFSIVFLVLTMIPVLWTQHQLEAEQVEVQEDQR